MAAISGPSAILACATWTVIGVAASPFVELSLKQAMGSVPCQFSEVGVPVNFQRLEFLEKCVRLGLQREESVMG